MTTYPGAVQRPISRNYTKRQRASTRGVILHVAASEAASLRDWFDNPLARASCHLYVRRDGTVEQYVDMEMSSWTSGAASYSTIGVETQGADAGGRWTPEQVEALAQIVAWAHKRYDVPLTLMRSSRSSERGVGWHRLGVPTTSGAKVSQTGGELWSSSTGKVCPGPARITQIPGIIRRAQQLVAPPKEDDDMTPEDRKMLKEIHDRVHNGLTGSRIAGAVWSRGGTGGILKRIDKALAALAKRLPR